MTLKELDEKYKHMIRSDNINEEEMYDIIYKMVYKVARRNRLFTQSYNYPDFSTYMAGSMMIRALDKTKTPVKSMLGYISFAWRGFYHVFINEEFPLMIDTNIMPNGPLLAESLSDMVREEVVSQAEATDRVEEVSYIRSIPKILDSILDKSIYSNSSYRHWMKLKVLWDLVNPYIKFNIKLPHHIDQYSSIIKTKIHEEIYNNIQEMISEQSFTYDMIRRANYIGNVDGGENE